MLLKGIDIKNPCTSYTDVFNQRIPLGLPWFLIRRDIHFAVSQAANYNGKNAQTLSLLLIYQICVTVEYISYIVDNIKYKGAYKIRNG